VSPFTPQTLEIDMSMQALPIQKRGNFCPSGYNSDGDMCTPQSGTNPAILKVGGFCPSGWHADGDYCVADSSNPKNVFQKSGAFCPSGYHSDGDYCVED